MKVRTVTLWRSNPVVRLSVRRSERNILRAQAGSILTVNFSASPEFSNFCFVKIDMLEGIVEHTNSMLTDLRENLYDTHQPTFQITDVLEMQDFI